jgi:NTP pyrophosphatase (non-canonical NTP hydrolase)
MNDQDTQILNILQEECAEVSQVICKIRRFGIDQINYHSEKTQRETLEMEIGDLQCLINLAIEYKIVDHKQIKKAIKAKKQKLKEWSTIFKE